jgi:hypothetical protein
MSTPYPGLDLPPGYVAYRTNDGAFWARHDEMNVNKYEAARRSVHFVDEAAKHRLERDAWKDYASRCVLVKKIVAHTWQEGLPDRVELHLDIPPSSDMFTARTTFELPHNTASAFLHEYLAGLLAAREVRSGGG